MIAPMGMSLWPRKAAVEVKLTGFDIWTTRWPLENSSYVAIALRLTHCNVDVLKVSLAATLAAYPFMAGRMYDRTIYLTNEGVPFNVTERSESSAPKKIEEQALLDFVDFRCGQAVRWGKAPLMTVTLTKFHDGSAVLGLGHSHCVQDGSSGWTFLADWARNARGEKALPPVDQRQKVIDQLPSDKEVNIIARKRIGHNLAQSCSSIVVDKVMDPFVGHKDWNFLRGKTIALERPRITFSAAEMARIKEVATPPPGTGGDGWVTSQEALAAYLLQTVGRVLLPMDSDGYCRYVPLLDVRKALGLDPRQLLGTAYTYLEISFNGLLQKSLCEIAELIHERGKTEFSLKAQKEAWQFLAGGCERKVPLDVFRYVFPSEDSKWDLVLKMNNSSKRELPNFGSGGGQVETALTNAGPTLLLPAPDGGVEVCLDLALLSRAKDEQDIQAVLDALRRVP